MELNNIKSINGESFEVVDITMGVLLRILILLMNNLIPLAKVP